MIDAHLKKLRIRDDISPDEEAAIRSMVAEVREVPPDTTVIRRGHDLNESLLLLDGWMARARDMSDGQRQISELQFSGDFTDIHGFTLKRLDHNVVTLTDCRIAVCPHDNLRKTMERFPHLARMYWLMTNIDAAIHREWTVSLGRRAAPARMAHLFCEARVRLQAAGLVEGDSFDFPLTQQELGECLWLTSVHVNRTLQALRRRKLVSLESRYLTIIDLPRLEALGEFDPFYLYLEKRPR